MSFAGKNFAHLGGVHHAGADGTIILFLVVVAPCHGKPGGV